MSQHKNMTLQGFLSYTVGVLAFVTLMAILAELLLPCGIPWVPRDRTQLLPGLMIGLGVFMALLTYRRDSANQAVERQRKADEISFEASRDSLRQAVALLQGPTNDLTNWVHAARLLLRAQELARSIITPEINASVIAELAKTQYELHALLQCDKQDGVGTQCLPPSFFLGGADWEYVGEGKDELFKAFVETDAKPVGGWMELGVVNEVPTLQQIAPKAVTAIYDFIGADNWPHDPLPSVTAWIDEERDIMPGFDQGARQYVHLRGNYYVQDGQVRAMSGESERQR